MYLKQKVKIQRKDRLSTNGNSGSFETQMVSQIVENQPRHFAAIQNILAYGELGAIKKDCEVVHMVCDAVSRRAAYMCAAGVSAIARKIHDNRFVNYIIILYIIINRIIFCYIANLLYYTPSNFIF